DEDEDWGRWRDVVFRAKGRLVPGYVVPPDKPPSPHRKERGSKKKAQAGAQHPVAEGAAKAAEGADGPSISQATRAAELAPLSDSVAPATSEPPKPAAQLAAEDVTAGNAPLAPGAKVSLDDALYCAECYLPLHPDPKPEALYIFLHALRYTTSLGTFETEMPEWAAGDFVWDRGAVGAVV
ncbi:hypothetical protein HDZ31DRAFT_78787, partial [Schizophyllum fasciatum]